VICQQNFSARLPQLVIFCAETDLFEMHRQRFSKLRGVNPDCHQRGPYEASEGIYPGRAIKTGVGQGF